MVLIGIAGKMGSGKDYITTNYIVPYIEQTLRKKVLQLCFADQIKVNVMTKYNVSYHDLYIEKTQDTRKLLQIEGTEKGRNVYGVNVWINSLKNWIDIFNNRGIEHFVITDVRFQNELQFIKNNGIVIKVVAPNRTHERLLSESGGDPTVYNTLKNHSSECDLDNLSDSEFDLVYHNDDDNGKSTLVSNNSYIQLKKILQNHFDNLN